MTGVPGSALLDRVIHHRIALGRYSNHVVRQVLATLRQMEVQLAERIKLAEPGYAADRLARLLSELRVVMDAGYGLLRLRLTPELERLAVQEAAWSAHSASQAGAMITLSDLPSEAQIVGAVKARPFQGYVLSEALDDLGVNASKRVRAAVRTGFIEGRSPASIAADLRKTILPMSRRGAEMMVRTAITHTASTAAEEAYRSMGNLVTGMRWCAILDTRTTLICAGLNGRLFPVGGRHPPAHWGCRSTVVPEIKGVEGASIPSYADWLKRQPAETQDDILGPARARLWRAGKVDIDGFTDRKGKTLTLAELLHH